MKTIKLFVYALIICMSFVGVAEAKGRSGSFKSGFSSQKRATTKPSQTYQAAPASTDAKKTAFGSFGGAAPVAGQKESGIPSSQMSKDLQARVAQNNALKTADARTNLNEKMGDTHSESGWFRSGNQTVPPKTNPTLGQPAHYQQVPQYNNGRQSSGLWAGLAGFMIGHSLAQHHTYTGYVSQTNQDANSLNNAANADEATWQQTQDLPAVETESFLMKLLRVMLWLVVISGVVWMVRKFLRFRNRNAQQAANYSLRS